MLSAWANLSLQRQITVVAATVGVFLAVLFLARTATSPRMELLYAGLEPPVAGDVITALEAQGARFEVRGSAIYVPAINRDILRMTLASEGLPAGGGQGYEILDGLSGFGTTSQMFDAAYWRAKEGELARTILASRNISAARVHISNPSSSPFARQAASSASVTVTSASGSISSTQATAIRYLVSSAVAGLPTDKVAVIDSRAGLIPLEDESANTGISDARAERLRTSITRLLEARVGAGAAIVEVSVDTTTERETISQKTFDPDSRVAISIDNEERSSRANNAAGGAVTVASNLPDGDSEGNGRRSQSNETTLREITNFEVSETVRQVSREPGTVRRITVAALVDGITEVSGEGEPTWTPRTDEEIEDIRLLIASAIGFDEARGDSITVRSMQLLSPPEPELLPAPTFFETLRLDIMHLIQVAVLALVTLILALFVVRPILKDLTVTSNGAKETSADGIGDIDSFPRLDDLGPSREQSDLGFPDTMGLPELPSLGRSDADAASRLRDVIDQRQDDSVEILSRWIDDTQEPAR